MARSRFSANQLNLVVRAVNRPPNFPLIREAGNQEPPEFQVEIVGQLKDNRRELTGVSLCSNFPISRGRHPRMEGSLRGRNKQQQQQSGEADDL
eukprot:387028_1